MATQEVKAERNPEENQDVILQQRLPPPPAPPRPAGSVVLPPPPPPPSGMVRPPQGSLQQGNPMEVLPPGIQRLPPPPPPPGFRPPLPGPTLPPPRLLPSGLPLPGPPALRPPTVVPPLSAARPPMMLPPGPPMMAASNPIDFNLLEDARGSKASFVKSAAPTVVKRPLAQHTPELTSMVVFSSPVFNIVLINSCVSELMYYWITLYNRSQLLFLCEESPPKERNPSHRLLWRAQFMLRECNQHIRLRNQRVSMIPTPLFLKI